MKQYHKTSYGWVDNISVDQKILQWIRSASSRKLAELIKEASVEMSQRGVGGIKQNLKNPKTTLENFLASPIKDLDKSFEYRVRYTLFIIYQKWGFLFDGQNLDKTPRYYVYAHVDPRYKWSALVRHLNIQGKPFYIGKGTGDRAWNLKRSEGHGVKLREMKRRGYERQHIVNIVRSGLTEKQALELESKLIYLFQTRFENTTGSLCNLDVGKRPTFQERRFGKKDVVVRKSSSDSLDVEDIQNDL